MLRDAQIELINDLVNKCVVISNETFSSFDELIKKFPNATIYIKAFDINNIVAKCHFIDCEFRNFDFSGTQITNCYFERVNFTNCSFGGASFEVCFLEGVLFKDCISREGVIERFGKKQVNNCQTQFRTCILDEVRFRDCYFVSAYYSECNFDTVFFETNNLYGAYFNNCEFIFAYIYNCNLCSAEFNVCSFSICDLINCEVNNETDFSTTINEYDKEYLGAHSLYEQVYKLFRTRGYNDIASVYFWKARECELKSSTGWRKIKLFTQKLIWGYGEKPLQVLLSSLILILVFAILYLFFGVNYPSAFVTNQEIRYTQFSLIFKFLYCIYFSIITFTTLGYGDITPYSAFSKFLASIEALTGVIFMAIFTASLYKKISKS